MRLALQSALVFAVVAPFACGGASGEVGKPSVPAGLSRSSATSEPSASTSVAPAHIELKALLATNMRVDLEALGLDMAHLPPLAMLEPRVLRKLMPLFTKSLGVTCNGCHADDIRASTPRKKVAEKMWNEFVVKLETTDQGPIFCDSCHQGRIPQLDRSDHEALSRWMDVTFTKGLSRRDGRENTCGTCHGDPRDDHFLSTWAR